MKCVVQGGAEVPGDSDLNLKICSVVFVVAAAEKKYSLDRMSQKVSQWLHNGISDASDLFIST